MPIRFVEQLSVSCIVFSYQLLHLTTNTASTGPPNLIALEHDYFDYHKFRKLLKKRNKLSAVHKHINRQRIYTATKELNYTARSIIITPTEPGLIKQLS